MIITHLATNQKKYGVVKIISDKKYTLRGKNHYINGEVLYILIKFNSTEN